MAPGSGIASTEKKNGSIDGLTLVPISAKSRRYVGTPDGQWDAVGLFEAQNVP